MESHTKNLMFRQIGIMLKVFISLRLLEFLVAIIALTVMIYFAGEHTDIAKENSANNIDGFLYAVKFSIFFGFMYYVLSLYIVFVFLVFIATTFMNQFNAGTLPFVNSIPYLIHSLPIMLGYFGGEVPEAGLWFVWLFIILVNFLFPLIFWKREDFMVFSK